MPADPASEPDTAAVRRDRAIRDDPAIEPQSVTALCGELEVEDLVRRDERRQVTSAVRRVRAPDPAAATQQPSVGAQRQVSFRLDDEAHQRVRAAAAKLGVKPTVFARLMTLRGADDVLAVEEGRSP